MSALQSVTTIVMVAFFLAYILNPLVERLTSWGLGRPLAAFIILLSGLSLFVGLLLFIVPVIIEETRKFAMFCRGTSRLFTPNSCGWQKSLASVFPRTGTK